MWWVREWLWELAIPRGFAYCANTGRKEHPGVSVLRGPLPLTPEIPMLHGCSSGSEASVWISGFSAENPGQPTSFGHLIRPGLVPKIWIGHFPVPFNALRLEWSRLFGADSFPEECHQAPIRGVIHKPRVTPAEWDRLGKFVETYLYP